MGWGNKRTERELEDEIENRGVLFSGGDGGGGRGGGGMPNGVFSPEFFVLPCSAKGLDGLVKQNSLGKKN